MKLLSGAVLFGLVGFTCYAVELPGRYYVAETAGAVSVINDARVVEIHQAESYLVQNENLVETGPKAHSAFVFSNGLGLFLDENTRIHLRVFRQEATSSSFSPTQTEATRSHFLAYIPKGFVALCVPIMLTGSRLVYDTDESSITIRKGRLAIHRDPDSEVTTVYFLEGDISVFDTSKTSRRKETELLVNEKVMISKTEVKILPLTPEEIRALDDRTNLACAARRTAMFDVNTAAGANAPEIAARPVVPQNIPANIVISPDRLAAYQQEFP